MDRLQESLLKKLEQIESELRKIGYWKNQEIDPYAELPDGETPHFLNASSFEDWLQFVFLPNAREAVRSNALPKSSSVGVVALRQYDYHSHVPEAQELIRLLNEFDKFINGAV